jgi:Uma2 family endonuclease
MAENLRPMPGESLTSPTFVLPRHRLTVDDYHKMGQAGIFGEDERIELIEGELFDMAPIGSNHAGVVYLLNQRLTRAAGDNAIVGAQNPLALGKHSEPQPDVLVLRPRDDFYRKAHPTPADVFLLVEVCETLGDLDRAVKIPLYAQHEVPEVWLIDLSARHVEMYRKPRTADRRYAQVMTLREGEAACQLLPNLTVALNNLF